MIKITIERFSRDHWFRGLKAAEEIANAHGMNGLLAYELTYKHQQGFVGEDPSFADGVRDYIEHRRKLDAMRREDLRLEAEVADQQMFAELEV